MHIKYIPRIGASISNEGVRHRTGTIKFVKDKLYFRYTPEHTLNYNNNNNNNNSNNLNGPTNILYENYETIPENCNFKIDQTLYVDCHGAIPLDTKSFILPKDVTIITYTSTGETLKQYKKSIPQILTKFKNKKDY